MKSENLPSINPTFSVGSSTSCDEESDDVVSKFDCHKYRYRIIPCLVILIVVTCVATILSVTSHSTESANSTKQSNSMGGDDKKNHNNSIPWSSIEDEVDSVIRSAVWWSDGSEFEDPDTYCSKALMWLKEDVQLDVSTNKDTMMMQKEELHRTWTTRFALACVYYSTFAIRHSYTDWQWGEGQIFPWYNHTNWLSHEKSECEWFGITCERKMQPSRRLGTYQSGVDMNDKGCYHAVTKLELPNNRLTGSFPREVTLLSNLKTLDLFHNWIWNSGEEGNSWLGSMTSLEYLYYGSTFFDYDQGIPTEISKLKQLKEYDCSYTLYRGSLQGDSFRRLESLTYLSMSGNSFDSSLPSDLARLSQLQRLYIQDASLKGSLRDFVKEVASSSSTSPLLELWLDDNHLTGTIPSEMGSLTNLASLSVSNNALTGSFPTTIANLRNMEQWWWYDNKLTGTIPGGNWTSLRLWHLDGNEFSSVSTEVCKLRSSNGGMLDELLTECNDDPIVRCDCCDICML